MAEIEEPMHCRVCGRVLVPPGPLHCPHCGLTAFPRSRRQQAPTAVDGEAYETGKLAPPDLDAVFAELCELARARGCYVTHLKLEVSRRQRSRQA